eukprot:8656507-Pyramimonas_sp.AAC.1
MLGELLLVCGLLTVSPLVFLNPPARECVRPAEYAVEKPPALPGKPLASAGATSPNGNTVRCTDLQTLEPALVRHPQHAQGPPLGVGAPPEPGEGLRLGVQQQGPQGRALADNAVLDARLVRGQALVAPGRHLRRRRNEPKP